jgi:23S rRNA pseudouridine1911/1915/1917 synthase
MSSRQFVVTKGHARRTVAELVRQHTRVPWSEVRRLVRDGQVRVDGRPCADPNQRVNAGQRVQVHLAADAPPAGPRTPSRARQPHTPDALPEPVIRFADAHVVVVDKPAALTTMRHRHEAAEFGSRAKKFLPATLADLLPALLARGQKPGRPPKVRAVHRLDKETSGLVVFARTPAAERHLGQQFRAHTVERTYLALVRGRAKSERIESNLVEDRGDGRRGSGTKPGAGQRAVTHVRVVEELGDFTLVECRLETGRTHQVRIHLGERGTPLCGERVYDRPPHGQPLPDASGAARPALHAASLGFTHPATGARVTWSSPLPPDLKQLLKGLRRRVRDHHRAPNGTV